MLIFPFFPGGPGLQAETVSFANSPLSYEVGLMIAGGQADPGDLNSGVDLFQARYFSLPEIRQNRGEAFGTSGFYEAFFRIHDLLGEGHDMGFSVGTLEFPSFRVSEISSGGRYFDSLWRFSGNYLLFQYHYTSPSFRLWRLRKVSYEIGGGAGVLPSLNWTVHGVERRYGDPTVFDSEQKSKMAMMMRLDGGFVLESRSGITFHGGFYGSYIYAGEFTGKVRGMDGSWYSLSGGGLVPMSSDELLYTQQLMQSGALDTVFLKPIQGKASYRITGTGLYLSAGVHF